MGTVPASHKGGVQRLTDRPLLSAHTVWYLRVILCKSNRQQEKEFYKAAFVGRLSIKTCYLEPEAEILNSPLGPSWRALPTVH